MLQTMGDFPANDDHLYLSQLDRSVFPQIVAGQGMNHNPVQEDSSVNHHGATIVNIHQLGLRNPEMFGCSFNLP